MSVAERLASPVRRHGLSRPPAAVATIAAVAVLSSLAALLTAEGWLIATAGAVLVAIILMLWRGDDPPILLIPALFQWSEVAIVPISTVWTGQPYSSLSTYGADLRISGLYGLLGVLALSIGFFLGSGTTKGESFIGRMRDEAMRWKSGEVLKLTLSMVVAGYILSILMWRSGEFAQVLGAASEIKSAGLFILTFWVLTRGKGYLIWALIVSADITIGLTGFFAEFKNSVLSILVAAIAARPRIRAGDVLGVGAGLGLLLSIAIFWSAIKADYREFMNQGTGAQIVAVSFADRLGYLGDAAANFDLEQAADGFDRLVRRHGYIEFLGLVMANVPSVRAHENGELTLATLRHISVPRFLWPEKPALPNDTEVMVRYTGLEMVWDENTSISIGYLGELYIDFGYMGGLLAAFGIGLLVGLAYRQVRDQNKTSALMSAGLCLMVALPAAYFGTAYIKLIGSFVMTCAVVALFIAVLAPLLLPGYARSAPVNLRTIAVHPRHRSRRLPRR